MAWPHGVDGGRDHTHGKVQVASTHCHPSGSVILSVTSLGLCSATQPGTLIPHELPANTCTQWEDYMLLYNRHSCCALLFVPCTYLPRSRPFIATLSCFTCCTPLHLCLSIHSSLSTCCLFSPLLHMHTAFCPVHTVHCYHMPPFSHLWTGGWNCYLPEPTQPPAHLPRLTPHCPHLNIPHACILMPTDREQPAQDGQMFPHTGLFRLWVQQGRLLAETAF